MRRFAAIAGSPFLLSLKPMRTLLLIDANSIIHRAFHALPPFTVSPEASAKGSKPAGTPTGALYGLASILLKLWREERPASEGSEARPIDLESKYKGRPDYAAALFDRPEPTFREEKYKEYKAQRPPAPSELISQIIEAHNLFEKFGVKVFEAPGLEADDLIATLAERFKREPDLQIVILTGDRDTLQLVEGEKVVVRTFNKGVSDTTIYDEQAIEEKYGFKPAQMVDYKALVGDPSDNIKGVPGVGPKTATELIKRFGDVESLYKNLSEDRKLEAKLGSFAEEAKLSKELVTLRKDAPIGAVELQELSLKERPEDIKEYFSGLGFGSLLKRLEGGANIAESFRKTDKRRSKGGNKQNNALL